MADQQKSLRNRGRAPSTGEIKNKSRLAALAPGENLKEKQVKIVIYFISLINQNSTGNKHVFNFIT